MAEEKKKSEQLMNLNITVVALVALVAIVGLAAIVLNGNVRQLATSSQLASAEQNTGGEVTRTAAFNRIGDDSCSYYAWGYSCPYGGGGGSSGAGVNSQLQCCVGGKSIGQCARQGDAECESNGGACKAKCI
jgi:hypothetical protein